MSSFEMDYNESLVFKELIENSRRLADAIMANIRRLGLQINFDMDDLTLADGNCFFRGILQQCRRPEVYHTLSDEVKGFVDNMDHYGFRKWIKECVSASNHVRVQPETLQPFLPKPWAIYWSENYMMKNGFWADATMVRCTAWFLEKDIMIISDDNDDLQCTTTISGNIDDSTVPTVGPQLYLGFARNHYQSILPVEVSGLPLSNQLPSNVPVTEDHVEASIPTECPACGKGGKRVLHHITMAKTCKAFVGDELLSKWKVLSRKETKRNYQTDYVKEGKHAKVQTDYRVKRKEEDPEALKASQRKWKQTQRLSHDENARNRNFLEDSKYGPIFICICCHRKLSRGNVTVFTSSVEGQIKIPLEDCIFDMDVYTNVIEFRNGKEVSPNNRYFQNFSNNFTILTYILLKVHLPHMPWIPEEGQVACHECS